MDEDTKVPAEPKAEATPVSDAEQATAAKKEQLPTDRVKLPQKLWS